MVKYSPESLNELRISQAFFFKIFLVPGIVYEMQDNLFYQILRVYTLSKDIIIMERLGTLSILGLLQSSMKIIAATLLFFIIQLFPSINECLLLSISLFATENFNLVNQMGESGLHADKITFMQAESLILNTIFILLSYTFHPFAMHNYIHAQFILFRLFANVFFTVVIGMTLAFLTSYSLKHSYQKLTTSFDNFDILMMILSPTVAYLMAESFTISGFLALMSCALLQSIYASKNLDQDRSHVLQSTIQALSSTCRSICEILMGIGLALHFQELVLIGPLYVILSVIIIQVLTFVVSWAVNKRLEQSKLISTLENKLLLCQNNTRGILCYTLALQNFNSAMVAITLLNILINSVLIEPVLNYHIHSQIKSELQREQNTSIAFQENTQSQTIQDSPSNNKQQNAIDNFGCFKSCLLNLHFFTLSNWLVKNPDQNGNSTRRFSGMVGMENFERFEDSFDSQATQQQIELTRLSYKIKSKSSRSLQGDFPNNDSVETPGSRTQQKLNRSATRGKEEDKMKNEEMKLKFSVFQ